MHRVIGNRSGGVDRQNCLSRDLEALRTWDGLFVGRWRLRDRWAGALETIPPVWYDRPPA